MDEYGVLDRTDDELEDSDKKGSRGIPSRTYEGGLASFGEKQGWALAPFFGVRFWGYRSLSNALIQLMSIDLPRVEYGEKKVSKQDIETWQKEMDAIKDAKPEKINLNQFIVDGKSR